MFVQSARFVENHKKEPNTEIAIYGQEKVADTIRLCKMNLAVHGLSGDIREGNTYYEDLHDSLGKFDFVMANPPFNVSGVDKEKIKDDPRFALGVPSTDIANYIWIQAFYSSLNKNGRAGFVMANSAADARGTELEIRRKLIEAGAVDVMISIGPNFFYTVTLSCTLWFLDKNKPRERRERVLFIDARDIYRQIDRAHRDFAPDQIEFLANIVRLFRGQKIETGMGSEKLFRQYFDADFAKFAEILGLCKVATIKDIQDQGWSLNPGRYVGARTDRDDEGDFQERVRALNKELKSLNLSAKQLEERIQNNVTELLR
jgi:type I restriction enzyme M protein